MSDQTQLELAIGGHEQVPTNWMPATQVRPFVFDDPVLVWLQYQGKQHGFQPDTSPYEFLDFIGEKGKQFQGKWQKEVAPEAVYVCSEPHEVRSADKVRETFAYIEKRIPIIAQPALWWAPERVYGVPDFLVHTSWLGDRFSNLLDDEETWAKGQQGHYVVFDIKFTTKLDESEKADDFANYGAQVRIYSYILGHLQGFIPPKAFLIIRDRILNPLSLPIISRLNQSLDEDLAAIRNQFLDIRVNGEKYVPWRDGIVASNLSNREDAPWHTAKDIIAREKTPGRDPALVYQIGPRVKRELANMGFPSLDTMLKDDPNNVPLEKCKGIGSKRSSQIRVILEANRSGSPLLPPYGLIPLPKRFEFYVDFEFFNNVNVDFENQWPTLEGCEMIFMVGIGWENGDGWCFEKFVAAAEDQNQERLMLERFLEFLQVRTGGSVTDSTSTVLYHWTHAEKTQARGASNRHNLPDAHPIRNLPWHDLQKVFLDGPCSVPGAWNYSLKEVAKALGTLNSEFDPQWPGDLADGLRATVMGWKAYEVTDPLRTEEMNTLSRYLEADCRALRNVLKWMRP